MKFNPKKVVADVIRGAYRKLPSFNLRPLPPMVVSEMIATLTARGLGDCLMLTDLPYAACKEQRTAHVWTTAPHFLDVMKFHPTTKFENTDQGVVNPFLVDILRLNECYDLGNGHQLQRLRRAWRLKIDHHPQPAMKRTREVVKNRVILHFEPSVRNVEWQRQFWHPRMREVYPENLKTLEKFIRSRQDLEFIEVGSNPKGLKGSTYVTCDTIKELIELVQTADWFIGIMSGPIHLAASYGVRSIVIVNYPKAERIVLPCLKWTGTPEEEWMYPQNVHLHQEGDTPLCPRFSLSSLKAAFSGDVYPFWSSDWLSMIDETL